MCLPNGGCKVIGGPLPNQIFSWLSEFSNTCVLLNYYAEASFLLDSCKVAFVLKASFFFQTPDSGGVADFLPTRHPIHNN
jgi:hypothetical protein